MHEWHADGVTPVAVGTRGFLPLAVLAVREGRTVAVPGGRAWVESTVGERLGL